MGLFSSLFEKPEKKNTTSKSRKGTTKTGQKASAANMPDIELPVGSYEVSVEGLSWCKIPLSDNRDRVFSLTPRNTYQVEQGWPESDVVNVCKRGSKRTTAKNWIGYIPAAKSRKLMGVVMSHGATNVHARVSTKGKNEVVLMLPEAYR